MAAALSITGGRQDHVLRLRGDVDVATADALRARLIEMALAEDSILCMDVRDVGFMDSTGIHVLMQLLATVSSGCVILHAPSPAVSRLLVLSGLDRCSRLHLVADGAAP